MELSFKRITSSGNFIPEIDGLRFIAIVSVVLYHLNNFLLEKDKSIYTDNIDYSFLKQLLFHGFSGVPLFFIISGYILGIPFAKFHILKKNPVNLKKYFLKRLTRLEPPYIIVMTILLFGAVYIAKVITIKEGILSYLSSVFYSHNFIYSGFPKLNCVTWSLEVEVQFYIIAPLMAYLFSIKQPIVRRVAFIFTIILFLIINRFNLIVFPFISLINYCQFFLVGFLLADFYVSDSYINKTKFDNLIGLIFFLIIWLFDSGNFKTSSQKFIWEFLQLISMFVFCYYVLFNKIFKFLSFKLITNIGGMCYSIYLLHYPIISMFGNPLMKYSVSKYSFINISIYSIILISLIMIISSIFFLFIERPCMDKNWYKNIFKRNREDVLQKTEIRASTLE